MIESRDSEEPESTALRSRRVFRWMPSAVLWHNLPPDASRAQGRARLDAGAALGRNLYARKLRESSTSEPPGEDAPKPMNSELWRWQAPRAYLVIVRSHGWLLTWHAPWCRRCDCPGAGWRFTRGRGYWSGLGFELSFP